MNPLNIIESIYSDVSYQDTLKVRLEREVNSNYSFSRFPLAMDSIQPIECRQYTLTFKTYSNILSRVRISTSLPAPIALRNHSKKLDWDMVITSYSGSQATLSEPLMINNSDLFYNYEDYKSLILSPLGILAILFRKSYGNEKFRQYVNSTLLREEYYKISARNSPTFYIYKDSKFNMEYIKSLGELFNVDRWKLINDVLVMSPYVFSWRD